MDTADYVAWIDAKRKELDDEVRELIEDSRYGVRLQIGYDIWEEAKYRASSLGLFEVVRLLNASQPENGYCCPTEEGLRIFHELLDTLQRVRDLLGSDIAPPNEPPAEYLTRPLTLDEIGRYMDCGVSKRSAWAKRRLSSLKHKWINRQSYQLDYRDFPPVNRDKVRPRPK